MNKKSVSTDVLKLKYLGSDEWSRPVYKDQFERLWKDVSCGSDTIPNLYSVEGYEYEGEPDLPISRDFEIID